MASYTPYQPNIQITNVNNWAERVSHDVDMSTIGFGTAAQQEQVTKLFYNAHETTSATMMAYTDQHIGGITNWMNEAFEGSAKATTVLQDEIKSLRQIVETQAELLRAYKAQLDKLPADAGAGPFRGPKVPEPPTFSGTDNKMSLEDWFNQVALYCSSSGVVTDHQRIVTALTRLRSPATTYMRKYFDDNRLGKDLGSWDKFATELNSIYGRRDDKEGAKEEITLLWSNKSLATKDFIKYAEQYRTLARIVEYENNIHIDKLRGVIPQELRNALVMYELSGGVPAKWEDYLELLLTAYKALHPEKTKSSIFGTGSTNTRGNGNNEPTPMEIDVAKKSKGKAPGQANSQESRKFCQICSGKGFKSKAKSHNTADCYDKPGNEQKRPDPKPSSSSPSNSSFGNKGGQSSQGGKKTFRARLLELLDEIDSDAPATPAGTVNVNTASITEIVDSQPAEMEATVQVNEVQQGPSRLTSQPRWAKQQFEVDFPRGL
jgi:hypothetical protein